MIRLLKIVLLTLALILLTSCGTEKESEVFAILENYKQVYIEDFTGELDMNVWEAAPEKQRKGGYWSPKQVKTENGNLVITTEYKDDGEKSGYYSERINWRNLRSTYGYYEVRCKVDNVRGAWSSFWLMPDTMGKADGSANDGAEIDIFESAVQNTIQNTIHYDVYEAHKKHITRVDDLYDGYHTYAVDWKKDSLKFYYDNKLFWEITDKELIPQMPVSVRISTEVGGKSKNNIPTPSRFFWLGCGIISDKDNVLPSEFVVDYVKIYDNGELVWSEKPNK